MSKARLDLPDPLTPERQTKRPRGRPTVTSRRLCSRAPRTMIGGACMRRETIFQKRYEKSVYCRPPCPPLDTHPDGSYDQDAKETSESKTFSFFGAVAQLGERGVRNAEVGSSSLLRSTVFCIKGRFLMSLKKRSICCFGRTFCTCDR